MLLRTPPRNPPLYSSSSEDYVPLSSATMMKQRTLDFTTSGLLDISNYMPQQLHKMHSCVPYPPRAPLHHPCYITLATALPFPLPSTPLHSFLIPLHTPVPSTRLTCFLKCLIHPFFLGSYPKDRRSLFLHVPSPPHSPLK